VCFIGAYNNSKKKKKNEIKVDMSNLPVGVSVLRVGNETVRVLKE
jgi:hypothetical protein